MGPPYTKPASLLNMRHVELLPFAVKARTVQARLIYLYSTHNHKSWLPCVKRVKVLHRHAHMPVQHTVTDTMHCHMPWNRVRESHRRHLYVWFGNFAITKCTHVRRIPYNI